MRIPFMAVWMVAGTAAQAQQVAAPKPVQQAEAYSPKFTLPRGAQVVVVYVGSTGCGASRDAELKAAIRRMKPLIARQIDSLNVALSISGVAVDWVPDSGIVYLKSLGAWDEMIVGNNWVNTGVEHFVWRDSEVRPGVPQVVIYEREVRPEQTTITFGAFRRTARMIGVQPIVDWVSQGAPLPGKAPNP